MGTFFLIWYDLFRKNKLLFFLLLFIVIALIAWFASKIRFEEDISKIIPSDDKTQKIAQLAGEMPYSNRLVFNVYYADSNHEADPEKLILFADQLVDSLRSGIISHLIKSIDYKNEDGDINLMFDELWQNLPLFLDEEDYHYLDSVSHPQAIKNKLQEQYKTIITPSGMGSRNFILKDPLGFTWLAFKKLEQYKFDEQYTIYDGRIFSGDLKHLLFFLEPALPHTETKQNGLLLENIESLRTSLSADFDQEISFGYFGSMAVSVSNAQQIKKDIILTVTIAAIVLLVFMSLFFRRKFIFIAIFFPAILGGGLGVAVLYIFKTSISAVSLGIGAVILGITVDYGLHYFNHLRSKGSVTTVLKDIATPVMMSSLTTAAAFLCLYLIRSEAMQDLGLFAAVSVIAAALFTLIVFPQFQKNDLSPALPDNSISRFINKIASYPYHKNIYLQLAILGLSVLFIFMSRQIKFEGDMNKMSYVSPELSQAETELDQISDYTLRLMFMISTGTTLDEALANRENMEAEITGLLDDGTIGRLVSTAPLLISSQKQNEKIERWNSFWKDRKETVITSIEADGQLSGFRENTFSQFFSLLQKDFQPIGMEDIPVLTKTFLQPYIIDTNDTKAVISLLRVPLESKQKVYETIEGDDIILFDRQFVTDSFIDVLKDNFNILIKVSLILVFVILIVALGRFELGLITFIPMFLSWIWTLGMMALFGIKFNIFNIVISTFIFGLGIDYSIFIMRGLMQDYKLGYNNLISYKTSILLSAITTLVGIGVLIIAKHPALQSIAISAIIGITSVVIIAWTLEPLLFNWLLYNKGKKRKAPITLETFLFSVWTFIIFLSGSILLTFAGIILFVFLPFLPLKRRKLWFHQMIQFSAKLIVYAVFHSPKNISGNDKDKFKEPAVVISNHQSHIDLMFILLLYPKMILLTNKWVQKHPIYSLIVRFADFYEVSDGVGDVMVKIEDRVKEGYSIMVFPEGSRSENWSIKRFHKGAFYISSELKLDIIPVILHGTGHCVTKGEPILKRTRLVTEKVLDRIPYDDESYGKTQLEKSRNIRKYMQLEYNKIENGPGKPSFYRNTLIWNYIYKGPLLEWYARIKTGMENNYLLFHENLPEKGLITDIGCGYGFMDYMLCFLAPERKIIGLDYDEDKIRTANHCGSKTYNQEFRISDVSREEIPRSDAFILADVLHYMPEEEQEKLLINCVKQLNPGGTMIIRDADREMKEKHRGTKYTEFFSTRSGFNKTHGDEKKLYFTSKERILRILSNFDLDVEIIDETKLTSNLVFIVRT